ncbi:MAG: hypothetical protein AAF581_10840, partial [Planctomycetota bacterium]
MTQGAELARRLTELILRDHRVHEVCASLGPDGVAVGEHLMRVEQANSPSAAAQVVLDPAYRAIVPAALIVMWRSHGAAFSIPELEQLGARLTTSGVTDPVIGALLDCVRGYMHCICGEHQEALSATEQISLAVAVGDLEAFVQCAAQRVRGVAWQRLGDFSLAHRHLARSQDIAESRNLAARLTSAMDLASLKWHA